MWIYFHERAKNSRNREINPRKVGSYKVVLRPRYEWRERA